MEVVRKIASSNSLSINSRDLAVKLDANDELAHLRQRFHYPKAKDIPKVESDSTIADKECVYLCGNSLGLQPKAAKKLVEVEMDKWSKMGVEGHFHGEYPWVYLDEPAAKLSLNVVGAKEIEVAIMNTLTANLHFLMVPFYRPTPTRYKILIENKAFPSDHYAVESQVKFHGFDPADAMVIATARKGEHVLRTEDILNLIEEQGEKIALVLLSGVQYYTGQCFDMKTITEAAHKKGCVVGFDLAHAVGNVILKLHDWNVDFACWCSYKYLNSGPGSVGGAFVHEKHAYNFDLPKFAGWWGNNSKTRFIMNNEFDQSPGASGYQVSNAPVLPTMCLIASLQIFEEVGMEKIRQKSLQLTGYFEALLMEEFYVEGRSYPAETLANKLQQYEAGKVNKIEILTPEDPNQRGCQLSLKFPFPISDTLDELLRRGIVCDSRKPDVIRIAPAPLYNSFSEIWYFVETLKSAVELLSNGK